MRRRIAAALAILGLVATGVTFAAPGATAEAAEPRAMNILVMGDSYSAGNGAGGYYGPKGCRRSEKNYAEQFGNMLTPKADVTTVACSGATTSDFFGPQPDKDAWDVPRQLDGLTGNEDLIFLTIGGNDVKFRDIAQQCLIGDTAKSTKCEPVLKKAETWVNDGTLKTKIRTVLASIATINTRARIVLLGYPYLEGNENVRLPGPSRLHPERGSIATGKRVRALTDAGDRIGRELRDETGTNFAGRLTYRSVKQLFTGHELWNGVSQGVADPWMIPAISANPLDVWYHPNKKGWREEAEMLFRSPSTLVPKEVAPAKSGDPAIHWITAGSSAGVVTFRVHASSANPFTPYTGAPYAGWATARVGFSCLTADGGWAGNGGFSVDPEQLVSGSTSDGVFESVVNTNTPGFRHPSSCKIDSASVTADYYGTWVIYGDEANGTYNPSSDPFPRAHFALPG